MATDPFGDPDDDPDDDPADRSDAPRGGPGLDALRRAASGDEHWSEPWRRLLAVRAGGSTGLWVAAVLAALALGIGVFALVDRDRGTTPSGPTALPLASEADTAPLTGGAGGTAGAGGGATGAAASDVVVQVAGAVRRPGVYHLPASSRLGDLVDRAGGLTPDADVDRIDLAAPLSDGALVYLPRRGQALPPGPVVGGDDGSGAGSAGGTGSSTSLIIDLNTATADQLDALPGVGPTTAAAIVTYREQHGPFPTVDALADVTGIGPAKLAQIRPHVHL